MASRLGQAALVVLGVFGAYWAADAMRHGGGRSIQGDERERRAESSAWHRIAGVWRSDATPVSLGADGSRLPRGATAMGLGDPARALAAGSGAAVAAVAEATATAVKPTPVDFGFKAPARAALSGLDMKSLAVGDVTGDARDDIVVSVSSEDGSGRVAIVFEQTRAGPLAAARYLSASTGADNPGLALGDTDGDGINDIVVGHRTGLVTFNAAKGYAATATSGTVDGQYLAVLDVDRDGVKDVFAQSWSFGGGVYLGDGRTGMRQAQLLDTGAWGSNSLRSGDLTGDGIADVLLASPQGEQLGFWVYPGLAAGGLGAPVFHEVRSFPVDGPEAATIGDFNGDGRADVALAHGWSKPDALIALRFQGTGGSLAQELLIPVQDSPDALFTADIDGNGLDDIVVSHGSSNSVGYLLQSATGFGREVLVPLPATEWAITRSDGLAVGDVNADRCPDIVVASGMNDLMILHGRNCIPKVPAMSRPLPAMLAE